MLDLLICPECQSPKQLKLEVYSEFKANFVQENKAEMERKEGKEGGEGWKGGMEGKRGRMEGRRGGDGRVDYVDPKI
jgi:hypothetical protein